MRLAATWRYVDVFLLYRLRDWYGPSEVDLARNYGLLRQDWSRKPAATAVSRAFAALRTKRGRRAR